MEICGNRWKQSAELLEFVPGFVTVLGNPGMDINRDHADEFVPMGLCGRHSGLRLNRLGTIFKKVSGKHTEELNGALLLRLG